MIISRAANVVGWWDLPAGTSSVQGLARPCSSGPRGRGGEGRQNVGPRTQGPGNPTVCVPWARLKLGTGRRFPQDSGESGSSKRAVPGSTGGDAPLPDEKASDVKTPPCSD